MLMGTNESLYAWMDEGFTDWATHIVSAYYRETVTRKKMEGNAAALKRMDSLAAVLPKEQYGSYQSYFNLAKSGYEEPLTTHADHFNTNFAYGNAVYSKGCVFLSQLGYIAGEENLTKIMLEYYRLWRFKHPNANDFVRVAEKVCGMKLDWYREYWVNTTKTIDYKIDSLWEENGVSKIRLKRIGQMPMPVDLQLTFKDGSKELHYIPMYLMFGEKPAENASISRKVYEPWKWTHTTYIIESSHKLGDISIGEIDPSQRLADIQKKDNKIDLSGIR
jgi:aminopeptidase N